MEKLHWIQSKILDRNQLQFECNVWRAMQKKIVFTNGCFDILHRGHLDLIARAAGLGNILIMGVNTDASVKRLKGPERPMNNEQDRMFQLASLLCVDAVCLFDEDTPLELIKTIKPDVLVKGGDYSFETIVGADFVTSCGGSVEVIPFVTGYSTTSLIQKIRSN